MTPRERVLTVLRHRGTASYKQICLGLNHRVDRDAVHNELEQLVREGAIEIVSTKTIVSWSADVPVVGTRSRYRLIRRSL